MRRECSTQVLCCKDFFTPVRERIRGECVVRVITWAKLLLSVTCTLHVFE